MSNTKPITDEELKRLDALEKAATPGPWSVQDIDDTYFDRSGATWAGGGYWIPEAESLGNGECAAMKKADAELIVESRNQLLAIRARIAVKESRLEAVEELCQKQFIEMDRLSAEITKQNSEISGHRDTITQQAARIAELENLLAIQSAQLSALREPPKGTVTGT